MTQFLNVRTALAQGTELLQRESIPAPRLTAEVLLGHAMGRERSYFYAHPEQELRQVEWLHYGRYLHERIKGKPTQYITRRQEFFGREFRVTRDVLIPRPETELLVETVLRLRPQPERVIDIGTGSGAIAVSLALEGARRVFATDLSSDALRVAKDNARLLGARVAFIEADLVRPLADACVDVVVSNPPYVPLTDAESLQREVRDWEPHLALFAGTSGTAVYERLIPEAFRVLKPGGLLALELGFGQSEKVAAMASGWRNVQVLPDLAGIPRVLVAEKP
ncbi:MAG TPA: peptide chain release factor N(5)-glutamine methyltransferase [Bryobacteraceae bacterium]|nr:peptide chain release factor N(5)-glutamine methyltransferase [Bryobacteraceae bacterium]